jgi:hypothetical protein
VLLGQRHFCKRQADSRDLLERKHKGPVLREPTKRVVEQFFGGVHSISIPSKQDSGSPQNLAENHPWQMWVAHQ